MKWTELISQCIYSAALERTGECLSAAATYWHDMVNLSGGLWDWLILFWKIWFEQPLIAGSSPFHKASRAASVEDTTHHLSVGGRRPRGPCFMLYQSVFVALWTSEHTKFEPLKGLREDSSPLSGYSQQSRKTYGQLHAFKSCFFCVLVSSQAINQYISYSIKYYEKNSISLL